MSKASFAHFIEQRCVHSFISLGLIDLDPGYGEAFSQLLRSLQRLSGFLESCLCEIDVRNPNTDFLLPRSMQSSQIDCFGGSEIRLASLKRALDAATFDPDKTLACLNVGSRADQQLGDCSRRSGSKRQGFAAALDAPHRGSRSGRRSPWLTRANAAECPPPGRGDDDEQNR